MNNVILFVARSWIKIIFLYLLFVATAFADTKDEVKACGTELNNAKRLDCYDELYKRISRSSSDLKKLENFDSIETKQLTACVADLKLGLKDPDSLKVINTKAFMANDGSHCLKVYYTATNSYGGRVKNEAICGFKTDNDVTLDPEHTHNIARSVLRNY